MTRIAHVKLVKLVMRGNHTLILVGSSGQTKPVDLIEDNEDSVRFARSRVKNRNLKSGMGRVKG